MKSSYKTSNYSRIIIGGTITKGGEKERKGVKEGLYKMTKSITLYVRVTPQT